MIGIRFSRAAIVGGEIPPLGAGGAGLSSIGGSAFRGAGGSGDINVHFAAVKTFEISCQPLDVIVLTIDLG
ncbi:hypothetical protein [Nocardia sp. alder85J]|uniref:hypothetical protein n=1 Tax=Nocardia sp. alder85J TaxID=2862949 RepID=UPI001CD4CB1C|nr:hypothetical protein [Nocardia sp. alder85J]MCX4094103.1 hypothetical protein [Nocardia sp. alder85J]